MCYFLPFDAGDKTFFQEGRWLGIIHVCYSALFHKSVSYYMLGWSMCCLCSRVLSFFLTIEITIVCTWKQREDSTELSNACFYVTFGSLLSVLCYFFGRKFSVRCCWILMLRNGDSFDFMYVLWWRDGSVVMFSLYWLCLHSSLINKLCCCLYLCRVTVPLKGEWQFSHAEK